MDLGKIGNILGFLKNNRKFNAKTLYKSTNEHKLMKKTDYNATEIQCNLCEPCLITINEHFRTHEGLELLY